MTDDLEPVLAVIPARGGSKGIPRKNIRELGGVPLVAHTIALGETMDAIDRCVVSTDDEEIAQISRDYGGDVPFLRPDKLARDETPMWPVIRHAVEEVEQDENRRYGTVVLLDPTNPTRRPEDVRDALSTLADDPQADGVVGVSEPEFNPRWVCVEEDEDGYMREAFHTDENYARRQDVPPVYRINAMVYAWRRNFVENERENWRNGTLRLIETPEERSVHIDTPDDLDRARALIDAGVVSLPDCSPGG